MKKVANKLIKKIQKLLLQLSIYTRFDEFRKKYRVIQLKRKSQINVVFIATFSSQWKYDDLYDLFKSNPRYNPIIVLAPMRHFEDAPDFINMKNYFDELRRSYVDFMKISETDKDIRHSLKPDIMFYTQPYYHIYDKRIDSHSFKDKLICYSFYSFQGYQLDWNYNLEFHERAWKIFQNITYDLSLSQKYAMNKGRNVVITGYLNADKYRYISPKDVWKEQTTMKKRIIWSPHFSVLPNTTLYQGNFPLMAEYMISMAKKYESSVQFALKPHPNLLRHLYLHPEWGKEKADAYYQLWRDMPNTQIEEGSFYDMFLTSDGMINDSGSFTIEYLYTKKPALNCYRDVTDTYCKMTPIGQEAIRIQYIMKNLDDIDKFIENVILNCKDTKKEDREVFYNKYLTPPNDAPVAQNIYDEISKALN